MTDTSCLSVCLSVCLSECLSIPQRSLAHEVEVMKHLGHENTVRLYTVLEVRVIREDTPSCTCMFFYLRTYKAEFTRTDIGFGMPTKQTHLYGHVGPLRLRTL